MLKAAQIDGAGPWRIYWRVVLPTMWPILVAVLVILLQIAIKTFDLVRALTGGGPGISTSCRRSWCMTSCSSGENWAAARRPRF